MGWWDFPALDPAAFYDRDYFQSSDAAKGYDDYASLEAGLRITARARLRRIERLAGRAAGANGHGAATLLDVGCSTGTFLDEARRRGWDVRGLEVSDYAAGVARARGMAVQCGTIDDAAPADASLDCVTLWDVIEHLRVPANAIAAAARGLRAGGVLALSTGDLSSWCARLSGPRWHLFNLPEHLYFFTAKSLRLLLERAGLSVRAVRREITWFPMGYLTERLSKTLLGGRRKPRRRGGWVVPITLFDIISVYAVKRP
ncbi:MAG: Ubiquinone biosynthesis O-methyltransferase [Phycisphaerae bacterium]|nr:Ubiquinone biosynthesis O-methyltransferase [Phycisphaerae bacterium]